MAILTSNAKKINGEYKAVSELQRVFGKIIFSDGFFKSDPLQANADDKDRTIFKP